MTTIALLILAGLLAVYAVESVAALLNLRALGGRLPSGFEDVYDPEKYARSQAYTAARLKFGLASSAFGLAVLLVFWFSGGFGLLDGWVRGWGLPPLPSGLAYLGLLFFGNDLISLPFQAYSTFVLEERFGFNKTTPGTFLSDKLKAWGLTLVLGGAFLSLVLAFFQNAGPRAWLYVWGGAAAFRLFLQFAAPAWIMPLFNKFTPLPEGELRSAIFAYAASVGFTLGNIFVMDGSRRSSKTNAFFSGFGRHKRIALFDTLIQRHTVPELVAVLAHEIGHYKMGHIWRSMALGLLHDGLLFYLLSLFLTRPELFAAFGVHSPSPHAGLALFGVAYAPVSFLLSVAMNAVSRRHEFEADRYSARTLRDPEPLGRALRTLCVSNLTNLTPHPFYVFLTHSHPSVPDRVAALRAVHG